MSITESGEMERLTTEKVVEKMNMVELAHNSCYAKDRKARYRDYDMDMDARDFARNLMSTLTNDELPLDDVSFDEEILENLQYDCFSDISGLIALFYRNIWAMADLRETLKKYEDAEEQGLLLRLKVKPGDSLYKPNPITLKEIVEIRIESIFINESGINISGRTTKMKYSFCCSPSNIGKTVFLTREEAEAALAEKGGA